MIPIKLKLTNFRSHESVELNFTNIEVAAILGENGVGKSSLIIGLLYVIWGKVPGYKLIDLINEDSDFMEARYSFLHDDDCLYRIVRGAKLSGKKRNSTSSYLTLSKYADGDGWVDISANSSGLTTLVIQEMMGGLTLDAAIYSSLAMQDEFSKFMDADPKERRQIFETISNVKIYDRLIKKAKARVSEAALCMKSLNYDPEQEVLYKASLEKANENIKTIKKSIVKLEKEKEKYRIEITKLEQVIGKGLEKEKQKIKELTVRLKETNDNLESYKKQVVDYQKLLDKKEEIIESYKDSERLEKQYNDLVIIERELSQLNKNLAVATSKRQQIVKALSALRESQAEVLKRKEAIKKELREKFELSDDGLIQESLKELRQVREKEIELLEVDIVKLKEKSGKVHSIIKKYDDNAIKIQTKIDMALKQIEDFQNMDNTCPYLGKPCELISADNLLSEIAKIRRVINEHKTLKQSFIDAKETSLLKEAEIELEIKRNNDLKHSNEKAMAVIDAQLENATTQFIDLNKQEQRNKNDIKLAEDTLIEVDKEIMGFEQLLNASKFDPEESRKIYEKIQSYKVDDISKQYQDVITAGQLIEKVKEQETNAVKTIKIISTDLDELKANIEKKTQEVDKAEPELVKAKEELGLIEVELQKQKDHQSEEAQLQAKFELLLKQCADSKVLLKKHQLVYETYSNLAKAYQMTKAFIVENSVPRYQESCNQMLDYLGLNIRIRIETLEEVYVKKTKETKLHKVFKIIVISGKGKERSYHTWSGGEKHRVNFALRHAMSMMLLNRSGAKLGLVVIDEGDSKLDTKGKEALLKVIDATNRGVFGFPAKVLFVTHSEDLKDRLPVKITLKKKHHETKVIIN